MNFSSPADMPVARHGLRRGRSAVDRGAVIIAFAVSIVAGAATTQRLDSLAIGLVIGSVLFALLAPLLAAAAR